MDSTPIHRLQMKEWLLFNEYIREDTIQITATQLDVATAIAVQPEGTRGSAIDAATDALSAVLGTKLEISRPITDADLLQNPAAAEEYYKAMTGKSLSKNNGTDEDGKDTPE